MDFYGYNLNYPEDCAKASKLTDRLIFKHNALIERFGNLPAGTDLIYQQLKKDFPEKILNHYGDLTIIPPPGDPMNFVDPQEQEYLQEEEESNLIDGRAPEEAAAGEENETGAPAPHQSPEQQALNQLGLLSAQIQGSIYCMMLDWCNIYAVALAPEKKRAGMLLIGYFGKLMGKFTSALEQIPCAQYEMSIFLAQETARDSKRCAELLASLIDKDKMLNEFLNFRIKTIGAIQKSIDKYVEKCRKLAQIDSSY